MSPELVILLLRVAIALVLYAFLAGVFYYLRRDVQVASEQIEETQLLSGRLVIVHSDDGVPVEVGREFRLQPVTVVGRGPTSTIIVPDSFVSTEHARIVARRGQWWLDDLNSRNGTYLNGIPLSGPIVLSSGDIIGIGRVEFKIEVG